MKKLTLPFVQVWDWIKGLFKDLAKKLEQPAEVAVKIVNVIKEYINNPAIDFLTRLTSTVNDDKIVALVRDYFPIVLKNLLIGEGIIKDVAQGNLNSLLRVLADFLNKLTAENRGKWWADLAALILPIITQTAIDKPTAYVLTQGVYLKAQAA